MKTTTTKKSTAASEMSLYPQVPGRVRESSCVTLGERINTLGFPFFQQNFKHNLVPSNYSSLKSKMREVQHRLPRL